MKLIICRLLVLMSLVWFNVSFVNQTNQFFVQFRIMTIADSETAQQMDNKIKSKSGIIESRTDYITSTYFCLLSSDSDYTKEDFENWFGKMGYTISCYNRGLQNVDLMISPHILKNCVDEEK